MHRSHAYSLGLIMLVVSLLLAVMQLSVFAQETPQAQYSPRADIRLPEDPIRLGKSAPHEFNRTDRVPEDIPISWSRAVYQTFRNGNWDIYYAPQTGVSHQRTFHSGSDIHPRLNRGATKIAFASNRDGDYEIYVINVDGSGLQQLTHNSTDDVFPVWSPDGKRIVFQAYRDKQPEVYSMKTDGSSVVRLTYHEDYDGEPTFSPDGSKIAFISRRHGNYYVFTMNPNGSGIEQINSTPFSAHPVWSPDGTQILYDADKNMDGWRDLEVMNADGSGGRTLAFGASGTDFWANSWSPDNKFVVYSQLDFDLFSDTWYLIYVDVFYRTLASGNSSRFVGERTTLHSDWQSGDISPPNITTRSLPPNELQSEVTLEWTISELGGAGIQAIEIQARVLPNGSWAEIGRLSGGSFYSYSGQGGETYEFRIRAGDFAGNSSGWRSFSGQITFYGEAIQGTVLNNVGAPVYGATVGPPAPFIGHDSDINGYFYSYFADRDITSITASKDGYGEAIPIYLSNENENNLWMYLPPDDNLIDDGSFENLTARQSHNLFGDVELKLEAAFSGRRGARFGSGDFEVTNLSNKPETLIDRDFVALSDSEGFVHVLWGEYDHDYSISTEDSNFVQYRRQLPGGGWSNIESLFVEDGLNLIEPLSAVIDDQDRIHLVWATLEDLLQIQSDIFYAQIESDGSWHTETVAEVDINWQAFSDIDFNTLWGTPTITLVDNRELVVVWTEHYSTTQIMAASKPISASTWSTPTQLMTFSCDSCKFPITHLETLANNDVMAVIHLKNARDVIAIRKPAGQSWLTPTILIDYVQPPIHFASDQLGGAHLLANRAISNGGFHYAEFDPLSQSWLPTRHYTGNETTTSPRLYAATVDSENTVHIIYGENDADYFLHQTYTPGTILNWSPQQVNISGVGYKPSVSDLTAGLDGELYFFWPTCCTDKHLYYAAKPPDGNWTNPRQIDDGRHFVAHMHIAPAPNGNAHLLWARRIGLVPNLDDELFHTSLGLKSGRIEYPLSIPSDMANPVASFVYQVNPISATLSPDNFAISVHDGITETQLPFEQTSEMDWALSSFDLSQWQGKSITLTWELKHALGVEIDVDDIAIGPGHADTWIKAKGHFDDSQSPSHITYSVAYGNKASITATDAVLQLNLPPEAIITSSSLTGTVNGSTGEWPVGNLPKDSAGPPLEIVVDVTGFTDTPYRLAAELQLSHAHPEIEDHNNRLTYVVYTGHHIFGPLLKKRP